MSACVDGPLQRAYGGQFFSYRFRWAVTKSPLTPLKACALSAAIICLFISGALLSASPVSADTIKIATWNIEHLRDGVGEPPSRRTEEDFRGLRQHAERLDADVVAVQEVENERALARVFDPARYRFFVSDRNHAQRTAFAVRKSISARRHPDLAALGAGGRLRHGVDIGISASGESLRLLSIHLKSFCFQGSVASLGKDACRKLAMQIPVLERWIDARAAEGTPFAVLGDFNRRFDAPGDDFWPRIDDGDPGHLKLHRATSGRRATCNGGRYPLFIDHIVYGRLLAHRVVPGSFEELVYAGTPLSDHCPVSVVLDMGRR